MPSAPEAASPPRADARPAAPASPRRARPGVVAAALAAVLLGLGLWTAVELLHTRAAAHDLRADLALAQQQLGASLAGGAAPRDCGCLDRLARDTHRLAAATGSAPYAALAHLPLVGADVRAVRGMAADTDRLSSALVPALLGAQRDLAVGTRTGPLDLRPLTSRSTVLQAALRDLQRARSRTHGYRPRSGAVRRAQQDAIDRLDSVHRVLAPAAALAALGGGMTGETGPRTYLVVLQTPAESRATGGLVGGFLEVVVDRGAVRVVRQGSNSDLHDADHDVIHVGSGLDEAWGSWGAERTWRASNLSPDFPSVAQVWAALYAEQFGVHVDGVVGVTPQALAGLLRGAAPVRLPDGQPVTSGSVVGLLERGIYTRFPAYGQEAARNAYQQDVLTRLVQAVTTSPLSAAALSGVGDAVRDGSLRLSSMHLEEQVDLEPLPISGALPTGPGPFHGWTTQNDSASKLDVYLHRTEVHRREPLGNGREQAVATLTLRNDAPASGLPAYVTGQEQPAGTNVVLVSSYLTSGALLTSVTVDGQPVHALVREERGHPVVTLSVRLPPGGGTATVAVTSTQTVSDLAAVTFTQAPAHPDG